MQPTPAPGEITFTFEAAEKHAMDFHERQASEAVRVWVEGINALLRSLDAVNGHRITRPEEPVLVGLIVGAFNGIKVSFDLGYRGYYLQALNVLGLPLEFWMSYWYLRSFPNEHQRFTNVKSRPLTFQDMYRKVSDKHSPDPEGSVRRWYSEVRRWTHINPTLVRMILQPVEGVQSVGLGPQENALHFQLVASHATSILGALLDASNNLNRLLGGSDESVSASEYVNRVEDWQRRTIESQPEDSFILAADFGEVEVRSGPTNVISSGSVTSFDGNDIEIMFGPIEDRLKVIFSFREDPGYPTRVDVSSANRNTLQIQLTNFSTSLGLGSTRPLPVGSLRGSRLYLQYKVFSAGDDKMLHYTFYLQQAVSDE